MEKFPKYLFIFSVCVKRLIILLLSKSYKVVSFFLRFTVQMIFLQGNLFKMQTIILFNYRACVF